MHHCQYIEQGMVDKTVLCQDQRTQENTGGCTQHPQSERDNLHADWRGRRCTLRCTMRAPSPHTTGLICIRLQRHTLDIIAHIHGTSEHLSRGRQQQVEVGRDPGSPGKRMGFKVSIQDCCRECGRQLQKQERQ